MLSGEMGFRDEGDAQRHKLEALERELEQAREQAEEHRLEAEKQRAEVEKLRAGGGREEPRSGSRFPAGSPVYVEWNGKWWSARVIEVIGNKGWLIHYDGFSNRWDEVVHAGRIASRDRPPPGPLGGSMMRVRVIVGVFAAVVVAAGLAAAFAMQPSGASTGITTADGPPGELASDPSLLTVGRAVWILWNGQWFAGVILRASDGSTVRVRYDGYTESFDEDAELSRIRLR